MNYIDSLKQVIGKFEVIDSESRYWDFVTDSQIGEVFHTLELAQVLHQSRTYWSSLAECRHFLKECVDWSDIVHKAKLQYDKQSDNLTPVLEFRNSTSVFISLLKKKKLTKRTLFQHCVALSQGLATEDRSLRTRAQADSVFFKQQFSRNNIKYAWKSLQLFLSVYHEQIRDTGEKAFFADHSLNTYFHAFFQAKDVAFPAVFVQPAETGRAGLMGYLEDCRLWLDVKIGEKLTQSKRMNLISLNSSSTSEPYEDRTIGETIEKAVLEAADYVRRYHLKTGMELNVRSAFFQIGSFGGEYDGASIGCAAFFAALTRLAGRHFPENIFFTGKIGSSQESVEGVYAKAITGWEAGFNTFVLPSGNVQALSKRLTDNGLSFNLRKVGEPIDRSSKRTLMPYRSIGDLYDIWQESTADQQGLVKPLTKRIHDLILRNQHFTGRKKQLALLRRKFNSGSSAIALSGLGGIGKTEISLEYAHRFNKTYNLIWRFRGEDISTILIDYARLAKKLNLTLKDTRKEKAVVSKVIEWLENHTNWLLIFDGVAKPDILFNDDLALLPKGGTGHVLITSRYHDWREWCEQITVSKFGLKESVQFLLKRTGRSGKTSAARLSKLLGNLPLALAQAAAYISKQQIDLDAYLELYTHQRKLLWKEEDAPRNYPNTVATTWKIAMDKINKEQPMAVDLLNFASIPAPDDIPLNLILGSKREKTGKLSVELANRLAAIKTDMNTVRKVRDQLRYRLLQGKKKLMNYMTDYGRDFAKSSVAISALKNYSLVEGNYDSLSIHNLVQTVTLDSLDKSFLKIWIETAFRLINQAFPKSSGDKSNWPLCSRLFRHALVISQKAEKLTIMPSNNVELLLKIGQYLYNSAQYTKAEDVQRIALRIANTCHKPTNLQIAKIYRALGKTLEARDSFESARQCYQNALDIDKSVYQERNPKIAVDLEYLGNISLKLGNPQEALVNFHSAKEYNDIFYVERNITMAESDFNIGRGFFSKGDFENAEDYLEKALKTVQENYGYDHPFTAKIINQLGDLYFELGQLKEAMENYDTAWKIDHNNFGTKHPQVAEDLTKTARVMLETGQSREAKKRLEQALAINLKAYGDQHHTIAKTFNYLGMAEQKSDNSENAIGYFNQALSLTEKVFENPYHPLIAEIATNYGNVLLEQGRFSDSRAYLEMAQKIFRRVHRPSNLIKARNYLIIARTYHGEKNLQKAQEWYFRSYDIFNSILPLSHPEVTKIRKLMLQLAEDFREQHAKQKGEGKVCFQSLKILRKLKLRKS